MQHQKTRGGTMGTTGKPKTSGANRENGSSRSLATRSQRVSISEKKRVGRVPELETQLARLQEELEDTKDRLSEAHLEADDAKKQLTATTAKLEEIWACEESRILELRKISQDRDRAWESELKAVQKHLTAAINENQKLNIRLKKVAESEADQVTQAESVHDEILTLRLEHSKTLDLVEKLTIQLNESKRSESQALEQLETLKSEKDAMVDLATALAANVELENELRLLKVQTEQWKKAAKVAAAIVLGDGDGDGDGGENSETIDIIHVIDEKTNSPPCSEDTEDERLNKKTSNLLKKFSVLLKKGQK